MIGALLEMRGEEGWAKAERDKRGEIESRCCNGHGFEIEFKGFGVSAYFSLVTAIALSLPSCVPATINFA